MKRLFPVFMAIMVMAVSCRGQESLKELSQRVYDLALIQMVDIDSRLSDTSYPRSYVDGQLLDSDQGWWCSGFYPGTLWLLYEQTGDATFKALAEKHTLKLSNLPLRPCDHDIGFQIGSSFGHAYRITHEDRWLPAIKQGALRLAERFSPVTRTTRSWDFSRGWDYPVIIDNLMNLEILATAARLFGLDSLADMACAHADATIENHFREDYTSYHLVDYDSTDGHVRKRETVQGYADDSAWARGQAWALYGYTMMAHETGHERYLSQAENIARMLLQRLPEDGIPYWDFDDEAIPDALRDASAAAVMASAFAELSSLTADHALAKQCLAMSERQVRRLASPDYLAASGTNGGFLLMHCVGNKPAGTEVDVPLAYADYYFIEALGRLLLISPEL